MDLARLCEVEAGRLRNEEVLEPIPVQIACRRGPAAQVRRGTESFLERDLGRDERARKRPFLDLAQRVEAGLEREPLHDVDLPDVGYPAVEGGRRSDDEIELAIPEEVGGGDGCPRLLRAEHIPSRPER